MIPRNFTWYFKAPISFSYYIYTCFKFQVSTHQGVLEYSDIKREPPVVVQTRTVTLITGSKQKKFASEMNFVGSFVKESRPPTKSFIPTCPVKKKTLNDVFVYIRILLPYPSLLYLFIPLALCLSQIPRRPSSSFSTFLQWKVKRTPILMIQRRRSLSSSILSAFAHPRSY